MSTQQSAQQSFAVRRPVWLAGIAIGLAGMLMAGQAVAEEAAAAADPIATPVAQASADNDSCEWANDGECDDIRYIGADTGACLAGTDATDCSAFTLRPASELEGNECQWAFDGECDDTRYVDFVTGACLHGTDTDDCRSLTLRPESELEGNSCQWAFDGECDHPDVGTGACLPGTDTLDCAGQ